MKVEDLMIGDWIYLVSTIHNVSFPDNGVIQDEGYITTRTPIKITTVSENCISYYSNKLELYITLSSEDIEPIPLTPEILEKNGFIRINAGVITYKLTKYLYWTPRGLEHELSEIPICHLNFVHELQHALKLCGIDKEIMV